jgi:hypothetical protein
MDNATAAPAATAGTILALDLGKYKTVACAYDGAAAQARFDAITTSRHELRELFERQCPRHRRRDPGEKAPREAPLPVAVEIIPSRRRGPYEC